MYRLLVLGGDLDRRIAVAAFCMMQVAVFLQVVTRYVLNVPLSWPEEFARYCLVWLTFMGASAAFRANEHIRIDALLLVLPSRFRAWLSVLVNCAILVILIVSIPAGFGLVGLMMGVPTAALQISTSWVYLPVPLSFSLMGVQVIRTTLAELRTLRTAGEPS